MEIPPKTFPESVDNALELTLARSQRYERRIAELCHVTDVRPTHRCSHMDIVTAGSLQFAARAREYKRSDLVVVFKAEAFLPTHAHPAFKALPTQATLDGERGFEVKYVMRDGLQSQGLIMHIEKFPELVDLLDDLSDFYGGCRRMAEVDLRVLDVGALLGVKRMEPMANVTEEKLGKAPKFYRKPKFSRLHECPNLFIKSKYRRLIYQETEKMDGSSMAVYFICKDSPFFASLNPLPADIGHHMMLENGRFGVCSINSELNEDDGSSPYWKVAVEANLPAILNEQNEDIVLQGELVGWNINGNRHDYPRDKHKLFVFDIWEPRIEKSWLNPTMVEAWCKKWDVQHVPIRGYGTLWSFAKSKEDIQARANKVEGEGLVYKCVQEPTRRFKVHSKGYLEKYGLE